MSFSKLLVRGSWFVGVGGGFLSMAILGLLLQHFLFRFLEGQELRQTLITIGISIIAADLMLAYWSGATYQFEIPDMLYGAIKNIPLIKTYPIYRIFILCVALVIGIGLWLFLNKTRIGMMIRAGVDDRDMLSATGINVHLIFALTFALGAGLAGLAGVIGGSALSISPGEDLRYLLASLVVVIVGGMGSVTGSAIGAILIGLTEQYGLTYSPTYGVVYTFAIMVIVLALRPQGIMGRAK
ncbi:branched-chain amino acid ABC transporter permease [Candidatus Spongiihabitans sp.]|uniref:branched-chain amino acid ABC transporter permease n=1 Tax=Candidatus Spongiihabitans sp. TaxID=3101308 RepID=UPI003C700CB2